MRKVSQPASPHYASASSGAALRALLLHALIKTLDCDDHPLVRAAADTGRPSLEQGVTLLTLADSIASREDSRAMTTAAALQLARLHLVLASRSRQCCEVDEANGLLRQVSPMLEHGLGASSPEITSAFDAMQHAAEDAHRILCPLPPDPYRGP